MDKAEVIKSVKQYAEILKQNFDVKQVILYGSYSDESAQPDSDIDVSVILDRVDGDYLMMEAKLYRLKRDVDFRIEPVLLEESSDKSGFLEQILKYGEIVYSSE